MDPLKPFTSVILSLWPQAGGRTRNTERTGEAGQTAKHDKATAPAPAQPIQTLRNRLRSRMATPAQWNAVRARQVFVECVLVAELGDDLAGDPAFGTLVQRVSQQLESDAGLSARLDVLLKRVAAGEAVA